MLSIVAPFLFKVIMTQYDGIKCIIVKKVCLSDWHFGGLFNFVKLPSIVHLKKEKNQKSTFHIS